jgi:hypothetical protein
MVQENIAQLSQDCQGWRAHLRQLRDEFNTDEIKIREVAGKSLTKEELVAVEHLHNQFHIQLINIHDLKHSLKTQEQLLNDSEVSDEVIQKQDQLKEEYTSLVQTLELLRSEFKSFLAALN